MIEYLESFIEHTLLIILIEKLLQMIKGKEIIVDNSNRYPLQGWPLKIILLASELPTGRQSWVQQLSALPTLEYSNIRIYIFYKVNHIIK